MLRLWQQQCMFQTNILSFSYRSNETIVHPFTQQDKKKNNKKQENSKTAGNQLLKQV